MLKTAKEGKTTVTFYKGYKLAKFLEDYISFVEAIYVVGLENYTLTLDKTIITINRTGQREWKLQLYPKGA